jgi:hypothetical protein
MCQPLYIRTGVILREEADNKEHAIELLSQVGQCARLARSQHLDYTAYLLSIAELELIDIAYGNRPTSLVAGIRRDGLVA